MDKPKVAVLVNRAMARSIFEPADLDFLNQFAQVNPIDELPDQMTAEFIQRMLPGAAACITCWGTPPFTDAMLDAAPSLKLIAHSAGSVKNLVPESFWDRKIRITSNAPVIAEDVAQTTLALILCSLKSLWGMACLTREGKWSGGETNVFKTRRLDGLKVGIVGASLVGREVIKILKPFGCAICLYDPFVTPVEAERLNVSLLPLEDLLKTCDVVTLHAPATEESRHIINGDTAPLFKDGALFVNTARGALVDEDALIKELESGRIFACIDVTDPEPPREDHPFRTLPNVVLTPHIAGGHTENGRKMLGRNSIIETCNYLTKGLLYYEVRREMLTRMA